ncbi:MAG: hypothetical protein ACON4E_04340 [Flavobacteriales bacterium]
MNPFLFAFFLAVITHSYSQNTIINGNSILGKGLWSENVAGIVYSPVFAIGFSYEDRFLIPELATSTLSTVIPVSYGVVGTSWKNYGDEFYSVNDLALSFARQFSSTFCLGIKTNYNLQKISNETSYFLIADLAGQVELLQHLSVGFQFKNPFGNPSDGKAIELGLAYWISDKVDLRLSSKKEISLPLSVIIDLNYSVLENLLLQYSLSNTANLNQFAIAYLIKNLAIESNIGYHKYLGFGPKIGISYSFSK